LNRKGAKDAKFLPEPGAGPKKTAGFGSGKDAHFLKLVRRPSILLGIRWYLCVPGNLSKQCEGQLRNLNRKGAKDAKGWFKFFS